MSPKEKFIAAIDKLLPKSFGLQMLVFNAAEEYVKESVQPSPWIAVSDRLPEPFGLVRIKRSYNGKESEYIGYRNNRPVYTGSDPSTDCAWWGLSSDDMTAPDGSIRTELLDHLSNYSDITVEAWQPLF